MNKNLVVRPNGAQNQDNCASEGQQKFTAVLCYASSESQLTET
jgi:hypothetical protein